ncbi:MAG: P-II family nitrogen regulator [Candidatus Cyclobacteriaceae bacterium M3_2C_046]
MKKVEAIIRTASFEKVHKALVEAGVRFMSFLEVKGYGIEQMQATRYRGAQILDSYTPRTKLEIVVNDNFVQLTVDAILKSAATGQVGDGKIFVLPVEEAVRIRNKQTGGSALN